MNVLVPTQTESRIHNIHPLQNIIGSPSSRVLTRSQVKNSTDNADSDAVFSRIRESAAQNDWSFALFVSHIEPRNHKEALKHEPWIDAMQEELQQFQKLGVWTLVDLPTQAREIGTRWVYKCKRDDRGIIIRNKARLVVQGFSQIEGLDYNEVYAPVARLEAIRLFLAYASYKKFKVYNMDIKCAFLYGSKGIFNVHLVDFEFLVRCVSKKQSNSFQTCYGSVYLVIVQSFNLAKTLYNKSGLVSNDNTTIVTFTFVNPASSNFPCLCG